MSPDRFWPYDLLGIIRMVQRVTRTTTISLKEVPSIWYA